METDNNNTFIIAILALLISIGAICVAFVNVTVTITHETFVGIIATFMGLCATFMVGYQIFSTLSINDKLKEIDKSSKYLEDKTREIDQKTREIDQKTREIDDKISNLNDLYEDADLNISILSFHIALAKGLAFSEHQPQTALICYLEALLVVLEEDLFEYEIGYNDVLHNIRRITQTKNPVNLIIGNSALEIKEHLNTIINHKNYPRLQVEFMATRFSLFTFLKNNGAI